MYRNSKKKRIIVGIIAGVLALMMIITLVAPALAADVTAKKTSDSTLSSSQQEGIIPQNIVIGDVGVGGLSIEQANEAVSEYVDEILDEKLSLVAGENTVKAKLKKLGTTWENTDIVNTAASVTTTGNIVSRYKALKDLQQGTITYDIYLDADEDAIYDYLKSHEDKINTEAVNASLKRKGGQFEILGGTQGAAIRVDESVSAIADYIENEYVEGGSVELAADITEPEGTKEELEKVKDVLGTFSTNYGSSTWGRAQNVANGCSKINGSTIYPGETFSVYEAVSPFDAENGYELAGSYENGTTVQTYGGGICQVSTTLYNAVIRAELEVVERHNHSMLVAYVDPSADAAIAGTSKDFKFTNNLDTPIYIEGTTSGGVITFTIYGEETRDEDREVSFVSETTSTTEPTTKYVASSSLSLGATSQVQSSHTGKTAILWKVTQNGKQVSKEEFNTSTYKASPTIIEVGVSSEYSEASAIVKSAISSQNYSTIKSAVAKAKKLIAKKQKEEKEKQEEKKKSQDTQSDDSASEE